jgi:hypothetical protein
MTLRMTVPQTPSPCKLSKCTLTSNATIYSTTTHLLTYLRKKERHFTPQMFGCEECKVNSTSQLAEQQHMQGKKHRLITAYLNGTLAAESTADHQVYIYCELCHAVTSQAWATHLSGSNHRSHKKMKRICQHGCNIL